MVRWLRKNSWASWFCLFAKHLENHMHQLFPLGWVILPFIKSLRSLIYILQYRLPIFSLNRPLCIKIITVALFSKGGFFCDYISPYVWNRRMSARGARKLILAIIIVSLTRIALFRAPFIQYIRWLNVFYLIIKWLTSTFENDRCLLRGVGDQITGSTMRH